MTGIPECTVGRVIGFSYLWSHEALAGHENGLKDRPCVILGTREENGGNIVLVVPITHTPPATPDKAVEIPAKVKKRLGLDSGRSWIVCDEVNRFKWPGPDIATIRMASGEFRSDAGLLPPGLFKEIRTKACAHCRERALNIVPRPR